MKILQTIRKLFEPKQKVYIVYTIDAINKETVIAESAIDAAFISSLSGKLAVFNKKTKRITRFTKQAIL